MSHDLFFQKYKERLALHAGKPVDPTKKPRDFAGKIAYVHIYKYKYFRREAGHICRRAHRARGGGLGSRPQKMYGERLGDGVEYHLMSPTPRR